MRICQIVYNVKIIKIKYINLIIINIIKLNQILSKFEIISGQEIMI